MVGKEVTQVVLETGFATIRAVVPQAAMFMSYRRFEGVHVLRFPLPLRSLISDSVGLEWILRG